jgi:hypothetical protein
MLADFAAHGFSKATNRSYLAAPMGALRHALMAWWQCQDAPDLTKTVNGRLPFLASMMLKASPHLWGLSD